MLEQGVVKGFVFVLHKKREKFFERKLLVCKVRGCPFPSDGIQGACNVFK
jgi:hypothetical protein